MSQAQNHFSLTEIEEIISGITDADIGRLISLFKNMGCKKRISWDEKELLNHVIENVLEGNRKWPTDVEMITFLKNVGRSLITNEEKKQNRSTDNSIEIDELQNSSSAQDSKDVLAINFSATPEQSIEIEEKNEEDLLLYKKITSLFRDDKSILCILKQKLNVTKKSLILKICSITETEYSSAINKIKYQLNKSYPNGYEHKASL